MLSGTGALQISDVRNALEAYGGYRDAEVSVVIEGYTEISVDAFAKCAGIIDIYIQNSVTHIRTGAFRDCTRLTAITIPDSVTNMGDNIFYECTGLESIKISKSITKVPAWGFYNCTSLKFVDLPESVNSIDLNAFEGCTRLVRINIPRGVTNIQGKTFKNCTSLTSIVIPRSVTSMSGSTFEGWTAEQTVYMEHEDGTQLLWAGADAFSTNFIWGYKAPILGEKESTTPLNLNLRKTIIDVSQPTFLSLVINPNTAGLDVISDDYYIQSNNNCKINVELTAFKLSDADESGYSIVAPDTQTWESLPMSQKLLAVGIQHSNASELSNGVSLTAPTLWSTELTEPTELCTIAANKRATFEIIAQHGYSVNEPRSVQLELVPRVYAA